MTTTVAPSELQPQSYDARDYMVGILVARTRGAQVLVDGRIVRGVDERIVARLKRAVADLVLEVAP